MTDVYETAARRYCADCNLDPDEIVGHAHPKGYLVHCKSPRWRLIANEMQDLDLRMACLRLAKEDASVAAPEIAS